MTCMKGGSVGLWADNYTEEQFSLPVPQHWSFTNFETTLKASFDDVNAKHEAQHQLELLKQAGWAVGSDDHLNLLLEQALNSHLVDRIWESMDTIKAGTYAAWKTSSTTSVTGTFGGQGIPMDIDTCRRQGLCFKCGKHGHLSRDCLQGKPAVIQAVLEDLQEEDKEEMEWLGEKEVEDIDSIQAHDELMDGSETPIPKFLPKGNDTPLEHGSGRSEGEAVASSPRGPHEAKVPAARPEPCTQALIDSGCTGSTIDARFVAAKGINTQKLACPIPVYNADDTLNAGGVISHYVVLQLNIRHEWLKHHNPSINWTAGTLAFDHCPKTCAYAHELYEPKAMEEDEQQNCTEKTFEEMIPESYQDFEKVFKKESFDELPP
ncbi:hypothetical protein DFH29DRAFT_877292 [Suillus ampliporus]|nr:hypothetical protein DFH29DRAFT_877292 [Suillus ampliporus]